MPFADDGARAPGAGPFGGGTGNAVSRAARIAPQRALDQKCAEAATTAGDAFMIRRCPSTSANRREPRAHPRAIRNPARCRLTPSAVGLSSLRAASDDRNLTCRSRRCARARAWLRGGPSEPTTSTSCRNEQRGRRLETRRRRGPGRDRLLPHARTYEPRGGVEMLSSRRKPKPEPELALRLQARRGAFFAVVRVAPRRAPRDQKRQ